MAKSQRNSFFTPLVVEVQPNGKTFKIAREFTFRWKHQGIKDIHVPVGFVTDFASIPRVCRLIIPKLGKHTKATVPHDEIYRNHENFTRKETDLMFRDGMKELGVKPWKYWIMWLAVRLFGWLAWKK